MRAERWVHRLIGVVLLASTARAQGGGSSRIVEGHVRRPGAAGKAPVAVAAQEVVLHRVGSDRAGPVDSTRTDGAGTFRFAYRPTGQPDAVYFVSTVYEGIAYISAPLSAAVVRGDAADVLVFDTTSSGVHLRIEGRHLVVAAPDGDGYRRATEVFDLGNDSARTLVARDSMTPLWSTPLPRGAEAPAVSQGDIAPAAVRFVAGTAQLFAPISPGIRQLALTYRMPQSAFPLAVTTEDPVGVFEVLLEEPVARASMSRLEQTASVNMDGRNFTRFVAQSVPARAVLHLDVPGGWLTSSPRTIIELTVLALGATMLIALVVALRRGPAPGASASRA